MKREVLNIPVFKSYSLDTLNLLLVDKYNKVYRIYNASIYGSIHLNCNSGFINFQFDIPYPTDYYEYYLFNVATVQNPISDSHVLYTGTIPIADGIAIVSGSQIAVSSKVNIVLHRGPLTEGRYESLEQIDSPLHYYEIVYYGIKRFKSNSAVTERQYPTYNG